MLNEQCVTQAKGRRRETGMILAGLCLAYGSCLSVHARAQSSQGQQTAVAQDSSTEQTSSPQSAAAPAAEVAARSDYAGDVGPASAATGTQGATTTAASAPPRAADGDAGWTPATAINAWLPHWLRLSGEFRDREEGRTGIGFTPGNDDFYGLTRARIGFDVTPTSWLHGFVQARDSEVIGANPKNVTSSMKNVFDLNQAYVEFRNGDNGWFSLKVGRQELYFGDGRLVANSNWSNASRSFDAVRLSLGSDDVGSWLHDIGAHLDIFAASVVVNYPTSLDQIQPGHDFYGVNLALTKIVPRMTIEPYVYLKTVPSVTGTNKTIGDERLYTSGLRVAGTVPGGFDYRFRYSLQTGNYAYNPIHAWAGYGILGYTIPGTRFEPRFSIEYNYASGNKSINSYHRDTFDLLYPTTHQWERITDLFGEQNIRDLKPGFDLKPTRKTRAYVVLSDLSLASRYDSLYSSTGSLLVKVPKGGAQSTDIGEELDVFGTYDVNRRVQIGVGLGHLFAGQFLTQNTAGASALYPYGFVDYNF